jgi:hypothetical protein
MIRGNRRPEKGSNGEMGKRGNGKTAKGEREELYISAHS